MCCWVGFVCYVCCCVLNPRWCCGCRCCVVWCGAFCSVLVCVCCGACCCCRVVWCVVLRVVLVCCVMFDDGVVYGLGWIGVVLLVRLCLWCALFVWEIIVLCAVCVV